MAQLMLLFLLQTVVLTFCWASHKPHPPSWTREFLTELQLFRDELSWDLEPIELPDENGLEPFRSPHREQHWEPYPVPKCLNPQFKNTCSAKQESLT